MFKQFAEECDDEDPSETIKMSEHYKTLAQHIRSNARELKALLSA